MSWCCPRKIANAARYFSTRKKSYEARFWYAWSCASHGAGFITYAECKAYWARMHLPQHITSSANHHINIKLWWRDGASSCVSRKTDMQIDIFDVISQWKVISVPILLPVIFFLILVTKLWDIIIRLCMCKGRTSHKKVPESKSYCKTAKKLDFSLPISFTWESKRKTRDEIY